MTDLEMTKLCAEAMGYTYADGMAEAKGRHGEWETSHTWPYTPLTNDAQAMALVKRFHLDIFGSEGTVWCVSFGAPEVISESLNRAIVEAIAKMQGANHG
jgi:hypothetical protein